LKSPALGWECFSRSHRFIYGRPCRLSFPAHFPFSFVSVSVKFLWRKADRWWAALCAFPCRLALTFCFLPTFRSRKHLLSSWITASNMPGMTRCWLECPLRRILLRTKSLASSYSFPGSGACDLSGRAPFSIHWNQATTLRLRRGVNTKCWIQTELKSQKKPHKKICRWFREGCLLPGRCRIERGQNLKREKKKNPRVEGWGEDF